MKKERTYTEILLIAILYLLIFLSIFTINIWKKMKVVLENQVTPLHFITYSVRCNWETKKFIFQWTVNHIDSKINEIESNGCDYDIY